MTIYAWPPVGLKSRPVWKPIAPRRRSTSLLTGKRYVSSHERIRLHAEFSVSARRGNVGAGYMDALIALMAEDEDPLVRLYHRKFSPVTARANIVRWYGDGAPVSWYEARAQTSGMTWYTGTPGEGTPTTDDGFPAVTVTGLPASTRVAIPGEFAQIGSETRMVIAEAHSDASGTATIRLLEAFTSGGACTIGEPETAVFEAMSIPDGGGPLSSDYTYDWTFRQVHSDEMVGAQAEVDPWR